MRKGKQEKMREGDQTSGAIGGGGGVVQRAELSERIH